MNRLWLAFLSLLILPAILISCQGRTGGNKIVDPPPPDINLVAVSFSQATANVLEGQRLCRNIQRDDPANLTEQASIGLTAIDGSAQAGRDYTPPTSQIVIPANQSLQSFCVQTIIDSSTRANKSFVLKLSNPQGMTVIGRTDQMNATIVNTVPSPTPSPSPSPTANPSPTPVY